MSMRQFTASQQITLLRAIHKYMAEHHFAPSVRELMQLFDLRSTSAMNHRLRLMQDAGYITRIPNVARSIVITEHGQALLAPPAMQASRQAPFIPSTRSSYRQTP